MIFIANKQQHSELTSSFHDWPCQESLNYGRPPCLKVSTPMNWTLNKELQQDHGVSSMVCKLQLRFQETKKGKKKLAPSVV